MLMIISIYFLKVINRIKVYLRKLYKYFNVEVISQRGFIPFPNKEYLLVELKRLLGDNLESVIMSANDEEKAKILSEADSTLNHFYDILGSGQILNSPINWSKDIKTGYIWSHKFYLYIRSQTPLGIDIKMPWELSRCHHLLWLSEAYILTKKEKYAKEVAFQLNDWIDNNPIMYTVNWTCAMEVAIRAINWMYALLFIETSQYFNNELSDKVSRSLYQHAFFIRNNLERQIPYSNNHYTSDIVGLLYISSLFERTYRGRRWKSFALKQFYKEVRTQVLPSGVHYERTVSYHRLMIELHSYTAYMLQRTHIMIPSDISELIRKMYFYLNDYTKINGNAPMVGDNDDGRFLPFIKRDFRKHNYLLDTSSVESLVTSSGCSDIYNIHSKSKIIYTDAGFAALRNSNAYVFISNGSYSKCPKESDRIIPTHTHNDLLSFELSIYGFDIIVDPGTYLYTSSPIERNKFRATSKHNTVVVDGEEQNYLHDKNVFTMTRNVKNNKLQKCQNGSIKGSYYTLDGKLYHTRTFYHNDYSLIITDNLVKAGPMHEGKMYFHFAEGIEPIIEHSRIIINIINKVITICSNNTGYFEIVEDTISPSYGVLKYTKTAILHFMFEDRIDIKTIISWN